MGLFAPSTVIPRMLLQQAWKSKLPWDKLLPPELEEPWKAWVQELPLIGQHPIPRRFFSTPPSFIRSTSIHGFADASEKAYGVALYFRALHTDSSVSTCLITAKARVLPLKHMTIPRAELLAAHLLARMLSHVAPLLDVSQDSLFAWTDSAIVFHWLAKESSQLKDRFVANRGTGLS